MEEKYGKSVHIEFTDFNNMVWQYIQEMSPCWPIISCRSFSFYCSDFVTLWCPWLTTRAPGLCRLGMDELDNAAWFCAIRSKNILHHTTVQVETFFYQGAFSTMHGIHFCFLQDVFSRRSLPVSIRGFNCHTDVSCMTLQPRRYLMHGYPIS